MSSAEIVLIGSILPTDVCARLSASFTLHQFSSGGDASAKFLADHGQNISALITAGNTKADAAMMDQMPNLQIIGCYGVGYDGIDTEAAAERGAWVSNTPDVLNDDVADLALALMLALMRQLPQVDRYVRNGEWKKHGDFVLTDRLTGKRLGMLGMGRIGSAIVRRALAFDMAVSYHATKVKSDVPHQWADSPSALAVGCDILCVCMPATAQTHNMVNAEVLSALGADGYLINVARGALVDQDALITALQNGVIKGAALDVFANEPNVPDTLLAMDNVVLSSHQGSATIHTRRRMAELVADNVTAVLHGDAPLTPVNQPQNRHS